MLKKALAEMKIVFKGMMAYKFDIGVWILIAPITLAVYYFLWKSIYAYSGVDVISGYTFNQLMGYFVLIQLAWSFIWSDIDTELSEWIRQGTLVISLVRPFSIFAALFSINLGQLINVFLIQGIPITIIGVLFFGLKAASISALILGILSFIFAMFLTMLFVFLVGMSSFWLVKYTGIRRIRTGISVFLGGAIMPLSFLPDIWQKVLSALPFQYMYYVPTQIFLGKYAGLHGIAMILIQVAWIIGLYGLIQFIWPRAMKHFSAVGG